jgi:hypothetical protein
MPIQRDEVLLERISPERLSSYLDVCAGDVRATLRLYEWNNSVAAALFEILGYVVLIMRNSMHNALSQWHHERSRPGEWFDNSHGLLTERAVTEVLRAKHRLSQHDRPVTPGRVVAELPFGFWRYLLTKQYQTSLWPAIGSTAFPNAPSTERRQLWERVGRLHTLRNRIAHHEPVHWRHLDRDLSDCLLTVRAVCSDSEHWVREQERVRDLLVRRPAGTPDTRLP